MPVIKIGKRKINMDTYVCYQCQVPCVIMTYPKPNHCPFGYEEGLEWVKKNVKVKTKGDR